MIKCNLPPPDWLCTRELGHDGPCAAVPQVEESFRVTIFPKFRDLNIATGFFLLGLWLGAIGSTLINKYVFGH